MTIAASTTDKLPAVCSEECLLRPNNTNCGGCGMSIALTMLGRLLREANEKAMLTIPACCGIVTAGMMVLGLLIGRENLEEGMDGIFPIVIPGQNLITRLEKQLGSTSCKEISGVDFRDLEQAMKFISSGELRAKCFDHVAAAAEEIARFLQELSEKGELFRPGAGK